LIEFSLSLFLISSERRPATMGLAPELESQLQAAHLEALVPVLAELGVEVIADLEFVQESDLQNQELTRQFCDWRKKALETQSNSSPPNDAQMQRSPSIVSKSTKLCTVSKPEALHPCGSQPHDPALDVDFHKIFGNPSLSADDVKNLYHDLLKKHHPDKGGDAEVFLRITEAYNVVMDPLESYLAALATPPPPTTKREEEQGPEADAASWKSTTASCKSPDTLLDDGQSGRTIFATMDKSGSMHMDEPFVPKRHGFLASLKLCFASVLHTNQ